MSQSIQIGDTLAQPGSLQIFSRATDISGNSQPQSDELGADAEFDSERPRFLYTHPVADTARYNVVRWTPAGALRSKEVTLSGKLFLEVSRMAFAVTSDVLLYLPKFKYLVYC